MFSRNNYFLYVFLLPFIFSCSPEEKEEFESEALPLSSYFQSLDPSNTGVNFKNEAKNQEKFNIFNYRNFYNGGGVGIIDVNNDGLKDIIFTGNQAGNKLYLNKGNFQFEDITESAGLAKNNNWSTGVAIVDVNQDGYKDIYICNAGYTEGISQQNELYINNGDKTFTERAAKYGLNDDGYTTHVAFFDFDGDGDLDVYILNNSFIPVNTLNYANKRALYAEDWDVKDFVKGGGDKLLRNDNGKFVDVSEEAGIYGSLIGFGLGVMVGDINNDNLPDIFVANDFFERDYLYINQGNGTFKEEGTEYISQMSLASMGADMADINNDGYLDIFTTEMLPQTDADIKQKLQFDTYNIFQLKLDRDFHYQYMQNTLQLNNQNNSFSEIAWYAGVAQTDWSWGALIFDGDMDGHKDLYVSNGVYQDVTDTDFMDFFANDVVRQMVLTGKKEEISSVISKIPSNPQANKYFKNHGDLKFTAVENEYGLGDLTFSNGAAYVDLNNDGALDLVINNLNQPAFIYKNNTKSNFPQQKYLAVNLSYLSPNLDAIGAKVTVYSGENIYFQHHMPSRGFQSSVDYTLNFGLGVVKSIDSLQIIWPNAKLTTFKNLPVDTLLNISYSDVDTQNWSPKKKKVTGWAKKVNHNFTPHQENKYVDFYNEGLIIKKLSKEAAPIAVADLNGNGLDDLVFGYALNMSTEIYFQNETGEFSTYQLEGSEKFEDTALHIFDANGDGKLDIFIGSGGNHAKLGDPSFIDRLYINNGDDTFIRKELPELKENYNTAVVLSFDYDGDEDLDLFIGSRSVPQQYGVIPSSFLLENDGNGNFKDMTIRRARELSDLGMVTAAAYGDVTGNGTNELVIIGEWMGIEIFEIADKQLKRLDHNLQNYKGWWYSVAFAPLQSGEKAESLILGNRGTNFYFDGTFENPAKLWVADFDGNGDTEKIISRPNNGKDMPIHLKSELFSQLPYLKKEGLKNVDYAKKSINGLFNDEQLQQAKVYEGNYFKSIVATYTNDNNFEIFELPKEAQLSSIHSIFHSDFNNNGNTDLLLLGNDSHFTPQFSKLDANQGLLLTGDGNGEFKSLPRTEQFFKIKGDVKSVVEITINGKQHLLIGINDEEAQLYEIIK